MPNNNHIDISVVIPAFNEEKFISICLDSLVHQKTGKKFEVIIVDNNSTDETGKIAEKYRKKLNLKVISEKIKGRGAARSAGFKIAKGEIILGTEADTIVPANWIDELSDQFTDKKIIAVTGTCRFGDCSFIAKIFMNILQPSGMFLFKIIFGYYWLSGFNFAIKGSAYIKSGGFNPELNTHDDVELGMKVNTIGYVKFINNLPVLVSGRRFKNGLFRGLYSYIRPFIEYFLFNKKSIYLDDIR